MNRRHYNLHCPSLTMGTLLSHSNAVITAPIVQFHEMQTQFNANTMQPDSMQCNSLCHTGGGETYPVRRSKTPTAQLTLFSNPCHNLLVFFLPNKLVDFFGMKDWTDMCVTKISIPGEYKKAF